MITWPAPRCVLRCRGTRVQQVTLVYFRCQDRPQRVPVKGRAQQVRTQKRRDIDSSGEMAALEAERWRTYGWIHAEPEPRVWSYKSRSQGDIIEVWGREWMWGGKMLWGRRTAKRRRVKVRVGLFDEQLLWGMDEVVSRCWICLVCHCLHS